MKKIGIGCLAVIGGLFLLGVIGVFIGGVNKTSTTPSRIQSSTTTPATQSPEADEREVFKMNEPVNRENVILTVTNAIIDWQSSNQFDKPSKPDDVYVVITVTVENQQQRDLNLSGFWDFKLEDSQGVQRNESLGGIGLNKLSDGSITSLSPGGKVTGDLIFSISKLALDRLILHYKPLVSFGKPAKIELQ